MNVWTITWRFADGSGSGIVPFGFTDREVAKVSVQVLQQDVKVHPQYRFIFDLRRMEDEPWHGDMPL